MKRLISLYTGVLLVATAAAQSKDYYGGELYSKATVKYGRYDVRMLVNSGSGTISSFFLYYNDSYMGSPEPWSEIDMEIIGKSKKSFQSNIITGDASNKVTSEKLHEVSDLLNKYHTYSIEWTPDYIAWFYDSKEVRRTTGAQATACQVKEMSIRFNLWISPSTGWVGAFDPSILPVYQVINWIRYSSYTPGKGDDGSDFKFSWQDDFNSFLSNSWGKGDWTFDENEVQFTDNNIVVKDGYCVLCLTKAIESGLKGSFPLDDNTPVIYNKETGSAYGKKNGIFSCSNRNIYSLNGRLLSNKNATSLSNIGNTASHEVFINANRAETDLDVRF
jgi:endo-1,3-1,4-beta-glycanase ExoK